MKNLLWIEDEPKQIEEVVNLIQKIFDVKITVCNTLLLGIENFLSENFDGVIVDIYVPLGRKERVDLEILKFIDDNSIESKYLHNCGFVFFEILDFLSKKSNNYNNLPVAICSDFIIGNIHLLEKFKNKPFHLPKEDVRNNLNVIEWFKNFKENKLEGIDIEDSKQKLQHFPELYTKILHDNKIAIELISKTFKKVISYLDPDFGRNKFDFNHESSKLETFKNDIKYIISRVDLLLPRIYPQFDNENVKNEIIKFSELIKKRNLEIEVKNDPVLTKYVNQLLELLLEIKGSSEYNVHDESAKNSILACREYIKLCLSHELIQNQLRIFEIENTYTTFIEYMTKNIRNVDNNETLNLISVTNEIVEKLRDYANANLVRFTYGKSYENKHIGLIYANKENIATVLKNVIENGIKYSNQLTNGDLPWIKIEFDSDSTFSIVEVESWGPEIAKEEIETKSIFREGYRGNSARQLKTNGTGVGLSHAYQIMNYYSGEIVVSSHKMNYKGDYVNSFTLKFPKKIG